MDAEAALSDDRVQRVQSDPAPVILLTGTTRNESAVVNREDERVEQLLVANVERDVDEYGVRTARHSRYVRDLAAAAMSLFRSRAPHGAPCRGSLRRCRPEVPQESLEGRGRRPGFARGPGKLLRVLSRLLADSDGVGQPPGLQVGDAAGLRCGGDRAMRHSAHAKAKERHPCLDTLNLIREGPARSSKHCSQARL